MRNVQGIRVTLDPLSTHVRDKIELERSVDAHVHCLNIIRAKGLYASLSVKLSSLGMAFDKDLCQETLLSLADEALKRGIQLELDMEGKATVDFTVSCARALADEGYRATLAVQSYLERSDSDIQVLMKDGITIRLVKGAYEGDLDDYLKIQKRMMDLSDVLIRKGKRFCIGTHDPVVIDHVISKAASPKNVEFGLLMGLGDETKLKLSMQERNVVEYVPYGSDFKAYVHRREVYLKWLNKMNIEPLP